MRAIIFNTALAPRKFKISNKKFWSCFVELFSNSRLHQDFGFEETQSCRHLEEKNFEKKCPDLTSDN